MKKLEMDVLNALCVGLLVICAGYIAGSVFYGEVRDSSESTEKIDKAWVVYKSGTVLREEYRVGNDLHRVSGPAVIEYFDNGNVRREEYWKGNKRHRVNGPAIVEYDETGTIVYEEYWVGNKRHHANGPAIIKYGENQNKGHGDTP